MPRAPISTPPTTCRLPRELIMIGAFIQTNTESLHRNSKPVGYLICENGCWEWVGSRDGHGYGQARRRGSQKTVGAHVYMWEQKNGPVPEGLELDHFYCNNPPCCNPDHVEPVTHHENVLRSATCTSSTNARKTHCIRGHAFSGSNLIFDVRGHRKCRQCRDAYRVKYSTIQRTAQEVERIAVLHRLCQSRYMKKRRQIQ